MKYRIVPVEIGHELPEWDCADDSQSYWGKCLAAAPKASEDDALVESLCDALIEEAKRQADAGNFFSGWDMARAVLRALEGGGE